MEKQWEWVCHGQFESSNNKHNWKKKLKEVTYIGFSTLVYIHLSSSFCSFLHFFVDMVTVQKSLLLNSDITIADRRLLRNSSDNLSSVRCLLINGWYCTLLVDFPVFCLYLKKKRAINTVKNPNPTEHFKTAWASVTFAGSPTQFCQRIRRRSSKEGAHVVNMALEPHKIVPKQETNVRSCFILDSDRRFRNSDWLTN